MFPVPRKRSAPEYLDLPESYRVEELEGSLADIRIVNRYLGDERALLKHLSARLAGEQAFSLLDVATGSADLIVSVADWARKKGAAATLTGVDLNPQTVEIARQHTERYPEITVQVADGLQLPFSDGSFDFVICSKTAHHLPDADNVRLITEMTRVARRGILLMDLRRSWVAWGLITLLTRIFTRNRLTRNDAPLSVLKSFTAEELKGLAMQAGVANFTVSREPFWLLVLHGELP